MKSIENFLQFINNNFVIITTIISLGISIYIKIKNYIKLTKEQKMQLAIKQTKQIMLNLVVKAEKEYKGKTGELKKSYVLNELYTKLPILKELITKEELEKEIDNIIEENVEKLKENLKDNLELKDIINK